ncbi:MAG: N-acetylglucosamine kinase [Ferruginibacter sp.]
MAIKLIADSGATKAEWCLIDGKKKRSFITQGLSPYFITSLQMEEIISKEIKAKLKNIVPEEIYFYGTGCISVNNIKLVKKALKAVFPGTKKIFVDNDIVGAAKGLVADQKGIVCNLGTGSFCCFYNGKKIVKNSPGLGYILGDEGSGAYLGKKVIQHFLYNTFDADLMDRFNAKFNTNRQEILDKVYRQPFPNRYLASFTMFLTENRGHYMIENIIEDGFNDFFFNHIYKFRESWTLPINFIGSVAYGFKDVLEEMCSSYELQLGKVMQKPMDGLIKFHSK